MVALAEDRRRPAGGQREGEGGNEGGRGAVRRRPEGEGETFPGGAGRDPGTGLLTYRRRAGGVRGAPRGPLGAGTLRGPHSPPGTPPPSLPGPARCAPVSAGERGGSGGAPGDPPPTPPSPPRAAPRLTWGSGGAFSSAAAARFPRKPGRGSRESPGAAFAGRCCREAARSIARGSGLSGASREGPIDAALCTRSEARKTALAALAAPATSEGFEPAPVGTRAPEPMGGRRRARPAPAGDQSREDVAGPRSPPPLWKAGPDGSCACTRVLPAWKEAPPTPLGRQAGRDGGAGPARGRGRRAHPGLRPSPDRKGRDRLRLLAPQAAAPPVQLGRPPPLCLSASPPRGLRRPRPAGPKVA